MYVMEFNVEERDCGDRDYVGGQSYSIRKGLKEVNKLKPTEPSLIHQIAYYLTYAIPLSHHLT